MNPPHPTSPRFDPSRRRFLRGMSCAAVGSTGILSALAQLRVIAAVAGSSSALRSAAVATDYKALVCLYLEGGNDGTNILIPSDVGGYAAYAKARSILAVEQKSLLPVSLRSFSDGHSYALHPSMPELQRLFGQGKLGALGNVGTLVQPTTLAQYRAGAALPPQLFSHSDQALQWQSSVPDRPFDSGWGGRLADLIDAFNGNHQISMSISAGGQNSFQVGQNVNQFTVNPGGVQQLFTNGQTLLDANEGPRGNAIKNVVATAPDNLLGAAFGNQLKSALDNTALLGSLLGSAPALKTAFPGGSLADQLKMIARLISLAPALNLKRQVFFCHMFGYDTHTAQVATHGPLLAELSAALGAFYDATVELGVANQVTTFTASDFGRTYTANSDGSDHGWGNLQLVMGGAVKGGDIYGAMPSFAIGGPDDTGQGRWLPSTSVDEYSATLASWFGVSATDLPVVLPNIGRFAKPNLGFMG